MDKLKEILEYQKAFQLQRGKFSGENKVEETKELVLWTHTELSELLNALQLKAYTKNDDSNINLSNIKDEIIDIFKFNLMMMNVWEMDSDSVIEEFYRKSLVVEQKWEQALDVKLKDNNCVCVDIDGVLCDSIRTWIDFLQSDTFVDVQSIITANHLFLDFSDYLSKDSRHLYNSLKYNYRESGVKRNAFVMPGAFEFLEKCKQSYQIVIVSARPVQRHRRIYPDTIEWLKQNNLHYDAIFFEDNKRSWVLSNVEKVKFCIEDDPTQALKLANVGIEVFLLNQPYNKEVSHQNIRRVDALKEIQC